jgi:hypothetical protein
LRHRLLRVDASSSGRTMLSSRSGNDDYGLGIGD